MGDVVQMPFPVLEFEGDAKAELDGLIAEVAELWLQIRRTLSEFESAETVEDRMTAHDYNVELRERLALLNQRMSELKAPIDLADRAIQAADDNKGIILATILDGQYLTISIEDIDNQCYAVMFAQRRASRILCSKLYLSNRAARAASAAA